MKSMFFVLTCFCCFSLAVDTHAFESQLTDSVPASNPVSVSYTIFTDFKGFSGDNPNGIVQGELFGSFRLRQQKGVVSTLRNITCGLTLSKLENNLRHKQVYYYNDTIGYSDSIPNIQTKTHLHYLDLVRYQNFEGQIGLNIVTIDLSKWNLFNSPIKIYVDFKGSILSTGIRDSTLGSTEQDTRYSTTSLSAGGSVKLLTKFIENKKSHFDLGASFSIYQVYNTSNNFVTTDGPLFFPETNPRNSEFSGSEVTSLINRYEFLLRYCPDYEKMDSQLFFRVQLHTSAVNDEFQELGFKNNSFLQVQLGYSASLDEFFKK